MKKIGLTILFVLLLFGCKDKKKVFPDNNENNYSIVEINIDVNKNDGNIDLSSILEDSLDIILLETNEECLISNIQRVEFTEEYIYVSDETSQKVYQFNKNGKFLQAFGQRGEGPGEYSYLGDFVVTNEFLYIKDNFVDKIVQIDINSGMVQELELPSEIYCSELLLFDDVFYCISNYGESEGGCYNLYRWNHLTNKVVKYLPYNEEILKNASAWGLNRHCSLYKEEALLSYAQNDTIYSVTKDRVLPQYVVKFSDHNLPEDVKNKEATEIFHISFDKGYIMGIDGLRNSKDYLFFDYSEGKFGKVVMYDKVKDKSQTGTWFTLKDWGGLLILSFNITSNDDFIVLEEAYSFKEKWTNIYSHNKFKNVAEKERFRKVNDQLSEDDNPVLFKFKFKNEN